ncbi:MAG: histidinol-phosphate aminotransferase [Thermomicrobiales bacterium]|nr:histidinol-phosphate aminotransferase [Thermomicrobiales bacterium]
MRFDSTIRLDLMQNPHGPCPAATAAIETCQEFPSDSNGATFRREIAEIYRVSAESVHFLGSVDAGIRDIVGRHDGPVVAFPPSGTATLVAECTLRCDPVMVARGLARDAVVGPDFAADLPENALVIVDSPSNSLGLLLSPADLVRMSRACACVVVDERFAEYSGFSLLPLARELDNVLIIRSFESWAGLPELTCAWAVASPRLADAVKLAPAAVKPKAIAAAIATLENHASVVATLKLVREERSRLYRFLRKLSLLEPLPSWAPFITARATIVSRRSLVDGLAKRGIRIHAPSEAGLEQYVRIGIGSRTAMDRLRAALLELGPELIA